MRLKRGKSYKKQMEYLQLNFKFREPYQILLDDQIIQEAVKMKIDLVKMLERTVQGQAKISKLSKLSTIFHNDHKLTHLSLIFQWLHNVVWKLCIKRTIKRQFN